MTTLPPTAGAPSHVHGADPEPLRYATIGQVLDQAAARWGGQPGIVVRHQGVRWTYTKLKRAADDCATGLLALGLAPGDRIGIWSPNRIEWVVTQFAAAKAGLILVNLNPAYRLTEIEYALNKVECKAVVTAARFKSSDYLGMLRALAPELDRCPPGALAAARLPALKSVISMSDHVEPGMLRFADVAAGATGDGHRRLREIAATLQPDDPINIQFTSGTTGSPKGATLTHFNVVNNGYFVGRAMRLSHVDRLCIPVPLYHCFGMVMSVLTCVTHGATMVFPGEGFEPAATLAAVAEERCTALHGVPTMFIAELDDPGFASHDLSSLRTGIMAGAPCPIEVMRRVIRDLHMREVTIAYGMTETSPVSFQSSVDDPVERRVSTVGRVHPHLEARIIGADGQTVPRGTKGELCTRGYSVMQGYWGDPERTAEAIDRAGWMHTGDLAVFDAEGYCNIVGRVKDMIIRGGENVYPREVEEFLYGHAKIQDVAVFGIPDPRYGEQIAAWVKVRAGETLTAEEVREFCRDQIAHYKIPHYVQFVEEFPMTVTGKIQKFIMRERMMDALGIEAQKTA